MTTWKSNDGTDTPPYFPRAMHGQQRFAALAIRPGGAEGGKRWRLFGFTFDGRGATPAQVAKVLDALEQIALRDAGIMPTTDYTVWVQGDTREQLLPGLRALNGEAAT